jgi:tricorn protease-like protein
MKTSLSPRRLAAAAVIAASAFSPVLAGVDVTPQGGMLRYPDVSRSQIAFVYSGDIWLVPREGGTASLLASPPGQELFPKFSPDGQTIAFVGNYEGNRDIYTIPVTGGPATRVTYHPSGETLSDWTPDGRLLFYMSGMGGLRRQTQLFTAPAQGGLFTQLPVPYGANGALSPDGTWLAYTPHSTDFRTWKRYRGGMATDIWLFNLNDKTSKKVTDWEGTDTLPMWNRDKVYYLSDQGPEHRLNIWVYSTGSGNRKQVTRFQDFDVKWPSMGPGPQGKGEIVFQNGASLYLLDLDADDAAPKAVKVTIPGDRPAIRPRQVNAADFVSGWTVSPTGKRAAAEARGDIWSLPAEKGSPRNMTRTGGTAERDPSWSPDGRWLAYFSDETGEYELYIRQSDGNGPTIRLTSEGDAPQVFRYNPTWSPDSRHIAFTDKAGALYVHSLGEADAKGIPKPGRTVMIDKDPWASQMPPSWSHDGQWLAYAKQEEGSSQGAIWMCRLPAGGEDPKPRRITSGVFDDGSPVFDRKGDYLFFTSKRTFSPTYSELDTTFIYGGTQNILAVPLRKDIESPWLAKSDEEDWTKLVEKRDNGDKADKAEKGDKGDEKKEPSKDAGGEDAISGTWEGTATGPDPLPPGGMPFTLILKLGKDGAVSGSISCAIYTGNIENGHWDAASSTLSFSLSVSDASVDFVLKLEGGQLTGKAEAGPSSFPMTARKSGGAGAADGTETAKADPKAKGKKKEMVVDFEGIEARIMMLPVPSGRFGRLGVNDKGHLLYARMPSMGGGEAGIKVFDLSDEKKEEKAVTAGGSFDVSADGKKLLVSRGRSATICDAAAGGGNAKTVVTAGMTQTINPREEWRQIFADAWRIERDFFYDPGMHRVDWKAMRERYGKMVEDASSRDDLSFIISEMISELNVGHAYYSGGDVESGPSVSVGMLGCDFELVPAGDGRPAGYRITRIYQGAAWDADARGPLSQPGINVREGDYLLAVNGVPLDTAKDPWAAFQGLANRVVTITVNDTPSLDRTAEAPASGKGGDAKPAGDGAEGGGAKQGAGIAVEWDDDGADLAQPGSRRRNRDGRESGAAPAGGSAPAAAPDEAKDEPEKEGKKKLTGLRDVVVQTLGSEDDLRYRAWIEAKRAYVEERTGGKVGYIYVPDTGQNGQNNLFRQFYGQIGKQALIIDERWNGGGQIPTRFIELLNRPVVNYWARRDGKDWMWPPDSHQGPKCMLINGLAGSGGDAFPNYFRQAGLGKLIGMRTWGGLVGISGNPGLIDGGSITAPTFGYYKTNGTWGIEGHGVDPDIEVVDDPAKMQTSLGNPYGGDPQLDAAIELMLQEIEKNPFVPTRKPAYPDRSGMGIPDQDR